MGSIFQISDLRDMQFDAGTMKELTSANLANKLYTWFQHNSNGYTYVFEVQQHNWISSNTVPYQGERYIKHGGR